MVGGSIVAAPLVGRPQPAGQARAHIGFLGNSDPRSGTEPLEAFRQGLRDLGWIENQTIVIDYRWAEGKVERLPALAAELVQLKTDLVVVAGGVAIRAAQQATNSVPIVIAAILIDPVSAGFVTSLAHPGGNITGLASQYEEIVTKQVQLLTEALPGLSRLALLSLRGNTYLQTIVNAALAAAEKVHINARVHEVKETAEFGGAFRAARDSRTQAILVMPTPFFNAQRVLLVTLAARYGMPALYEFREYVLDGGLMSYGADLPDMYRRSATYVDRILKGAKPGDLPVERATKFDLVINLKTAKALGLTIPPSLLDRSDRVMN